MVASVSDEQYAKGLARAFGGAVIFAFPLLMTTEMWDLGFAMNPWRLALFLLMSLPLLFGLSYYAGFRETFGWRDDALDVLAALAVGFVTAFLMLGLFGVITTGDSPTTIAGRTALQAVPAAFGALLARRQLRGGEKETPDDADEDRRDGHFAQLFLMLAGALFVAFNVAPTEEVSLIAYQSGSWQTLGLMVLSIVLLHALVYTVGFAGQHEHGGQARALVTYSLPGYAIALAVSGYMLWSFGRLEGVALGEAVRLAAVLGFPAALGAAAARLLV